MTNETIDEYGDFIQKKFDLGKISESKAIRLIDKLNEWVDVWNDLRDEELFWGMEVK